MGAMATPAVGPAWFSLTEDRFDQRTFGGRARKFFNVVDPRTLLPGPLLGMPLDEVGPAWPLDRLVD
jgi:hypothetical protein